MLSGHAHRDSVPDDTSVKLHFCEHVAEKLDSRLLRQQTPQKGTRTTVMQLKAFPQLALSLCFFHLI